MYHLLLYVERLGWCKWYKTTVKTNQLTGAKGGGRIQQVLIAVYYDVCYVRVALTREDNT